MSMEKDIILPNRYGDKNRLVHVGENTYVLNFDPNGSCCRLIFDEDPGSIKAVDPSGGPFISVGDEVDGRVVKEIMMIENKIHITFE